jgi:hypothetical protein
MMSVSVNKGRKGELSQFKAARHREEQIATCNSCKIREEEEWQNKNKRLARQGCTSELCSNCAEKESREQLTA